VAANLAYSDLIPMLIALEAQVELPGPRVAKTISVLDYVTSGVTPGMNSLITRIVVPRLDRRRLAACGNVRGSANARSLLSAAVSFTSTGLETQEPIIALGGVGRHVVRLTTAEKALEAKPLPPIDELAAMISRCVRPTSTPFASAPYIKHQAAVVVALAFRKALRPKGDRG
jgi:CO/xanthine dehydrogenase FAD-binding subunit